MSSSDHVIKTRAELLALYGETNPMSLAKEMPVLAPAYREWIERAPFFALASSGSGGLDCTPRGDAVGSVLQVLDDATIAFPDRRGNNRIDTLKNIVEDPRVALLFLTPGINETLRINGTAQITTDPELLSRFEMKGKQPAAVIVVKIGAVYFQCARALMRSSLWDVEAQFKRGDLPTAGQMTKSASEDFDAETYDAALVERQKGSLY
ncbi:MAG: pyridoxamine 5'-phosphate oxidase family protein [Hyphomicrobiales bacterium]